MNLVIGPSNYDVKSYDFTHVDRVLCTDHLGGFDQALRSTFFDQLSQCVDKNVVVATEYILPDSVKNNYPGLNLKFNRAEMIRGNHISELSEYTRHPDLKFNNFICSFNGSTHIGRTLLISALHKFGYFNADVSTKNITWSIAQQSGYIHDYSNERSDYYEKFFTWDQDFLNKIYSINYSRFDHKNNLTFLEDRLTGSFLHIVSETLSTSYVPFVTEKFLYSVVTRGLFVSYAQPGWHKHVEKYFGFKHYNKLFDYSFDTIQNPIVRLVELLTMVSKYRSMSKDDWHDLYLMERDTIEYNYNHFFSGDYLTWLKQNAT